MLKVYKALREGQAGRVFGSTKWVVRMGHHMVSRVNYHRQERCKVRVDYVDVSL